MYLRMVGVIFCWLGGWHPVSHGVREMLGLCVLHNIVVFIDCCHTLFYIVIYTQWECQTLRLQSIK